MQTKNTEIARIFNKLADLLELEGENPFRIRAYRNAAMAVQNYPHDISQMVKNKEDLTQLPAIGADLAQKIDDIVNNKEVELLKRLKESNPLDYEQLNRVSGLGAKRIKRLYNELGVKNLEDLANAAKEHKIQNLSGFSKKLEDEIIDEIKKIKKRGNRIKLSTADEYALPLVEYLKKDPCVEDIEIAGSYRRRQETVGDLDILITCNRPNSVMKRFIDYEDVDKVLFYGKTRASIILKSGLQVDLRVVPKKSFGAALNYFTGSKAHNIHLRTLAKQKNWKINEYGIFEGEKFIGGKSEDEIYKKLGLPYIEPELRGNGEELEAAQKGDLPDLIEIEDIKGDLHTHTTLTDGRNSLFEMALFAKNTMGYKYMANTEHSKRLAMTGGLDEVALAKNIDAIDEMNENFNDFKILKSIEVDILEDGSLDLSNDILKKLDIVVCSIHYKFNLSKQEQTERVLRAMDNPYFNILAHPTGRLINQREPYEIDMEKIMYKAKENNCFLEINSQPSRLDLNDYYIKMGKDIGIKFAISTDAHSISDFFNIKYGIWQARRGWLSKDDVINTRNLKDLMKLIKRKY